jgi:peptidoglycan/xylan/chitin deacetylase (PgdA/CDA1 family)
VALTFDDGPWPGSSDSVLSILRKRHVPATFFVIGYLAQRYPGQVSAEVGAGMSIGNHTWDHPTDPSVTELPRAKLRTEITSTDDVLRSIGVRPVLFRPPGGSDDPAVTGLCLSYGLRVVRWSIDPRDWEDGVTAKQIVERVLSNVRPGSIILLHDGGGDQSATVTALPRIIKGIRSRGLGFATLS